MNLIVAVTKNWGIGCDGKLLFSIKEDQQHFKAKTIGKVVVMGHTTYKSLPNSRRPLPNRTNIVLSRNQNLLIPDVITCSSFEELDNTLTEYKQEDIFIIGGEEIYNQLLDRCTIAYITKIYAEHPANKFFPNLDEMAEWVLAEESETKYHNSIEYRFCVYLKEK